MALIEFMVAGNPKPKGSMRAFVPKGWTRPILTSSNPGVKDWESAIRGVAQNFSDAYSTGPVRVRLRFALRAPKRVPCHHHVKRPDLDKLCRAALDACTGVLWKDDSQVYSLGATKRYATNHEPPHVRILIRSV